MYVRVVLIINLQPFFLKSSEIEFFSKLENSTLLSNKPWQTSSRKHIIILIAILFLGFF